MCLSCGVNGGVLSIIYYLVCVYPVVLTVVFYHLLLDVCLSCGVNSGVLSIIFYHLLLGVCLYCCVNSGALSIIYHLVCVYTRFC